MSLQLSSQDLTQLLSFNICSSAVKPLSYSETVSAFLITSQMSKVSGVIVFVQQEATNSFCRRRLNVSIQLVKV